MTVSNHFDPRRNPFVSSHCLSIVSVTREPRATQTGAGLIRYSILSSCPFFTLSEMMKAPAWLGWGFDLGGRPLRAGTPVCFEVAPRNGLLGRFGARASSSGEPLSDRRSRRRLIPRGPQDFALAIYSSSVLESESDDTARPSAC